MIPRGLIVSVQAPEESPLRDPDVMRAIALAAEQGGAVGLRVQGEADIAAVAAAVALPMIGLIKRNVAGSDVYITPEPADARVVVAAGASVVAADATLRARPGGWSFADIVQAVEDVPVLADVDSLDAGLAARAAGAFAVATTLSGYTGPGPAGAKPDLELVKRLVAELDCPVVAEGRYGSPDDVRAALSLGAHAVVVGTAITDPLALTRRFASAAGAAHG